MQEQSDFLKKLDEAGSIIPPPAPNQQFSPVQAKIKDLRQLIDKLELEQDMCKVCSGEARGTCDRGHTNSHLQVLRDEIVKLEESLV